MRLRNSFSTETRELFRDIQYTCYMCGTNGGGCTELNHIAGRVSNSPVNASVLCCFCHAHEGHEFNHEKELFKKTLVYLTKVKYNFTAKDISFIESHEAARQALLELAN